MFVLLRRRTGAPPRAVSCQELRTHSGQRVPARKFQRRPARLSRCCGTPSAEPRPRRQRAVMPRRRPRTASAVACRRRKRCTVTSPRRLSREGRGSWWPAVAHYPAAPALSGRNTHAACRPPRCCSSAATCCSTCAAPAATAAAARGSPKQAGTAHCAPCDGEAARERGRLGRRRVALGRRRQRLRDERRQDGGDRHVVGVEVGQQPHGAARQHPDEHERDNAHNGQREQHAQQRHRAVQHPQLHLVRRLWTVGGRGVRVRARRGGCVAAPTAARARTTGKRVQAKTARTRRPEATVFHTVLGASWCQM